MRRRVSRVRRAVPSEEAGRTLSQSRLTTGGLAEHARACGAGNDGLCVREDGGDGEAACGSRRAAVRRARAGWGVARDDDVPGHLTSMKYEFGDCTKRLSLCLRASVVAVGLRRSTARVYSIHRAREGEAVISDTIARDKNSTFGHGFARCTSEYAPFLRCRELLVGNLKLATTKEKE